MQDRYNREINYLRISVTDKCNFNCRYCKPDNSPSFLESKLLTDDEILKIVLGASKIGFNKIRLTGGEPLVRHGIIELVSKIKAIDGINEVVMTTNGSLLPRKIKELKKAGLDRVNISLDTLDPVKFKYITGGGNILDILESIENLLLLEMNPVKINVVLMKGFNDNEIMDFINLTKDKEVIVRFIELMPIGSHEFPFEKYYLSNNEVLKQCPELTRLDNSHIETAIYYNVPNYKGKIGLISPISNHFCNSCNRLRITSDGLLKTCLHGNVEYDLLKCIREDIEPIEDFLKNSIMLKPKSHKINQKDFQKVDRNMYKIGG